MINYFEIDENYKKIEAIKNLTTVDFFNFIGINIEYKRKINKEIIDLIYGIFCNLRNKSVEKINTETISLIFSYLNSSKIDTKKNQTLFFTTLWNYLSNEERINLFEIMDSEENKGITVLNDEYKDLAKKAKYRRSGRNKVIQRSYNRTILLDENELFNIIDYDKYKRIIMHSLANKDYEINEKNLITIFNDINKKVCNSKDKNEKLSLLINCFPMENMSKGIFRKTFFDNSIFDFKLYESITHCIKYYIKSKKLVQNKDTNRNLGFFVAYSCFFIPLAKYHKLTNIFELKKIDDFIGTYFISSPLPIKNTILPYSYLLFIKDASKLRNTNGLIQNYQYSLLLELKNFYDFIIARKESFKIKNDFQNPILNTDLPRTIKRHESSKVRLPSEIFWLFFSYTNKIIEIINLINEKSMKSEIDSKTITKILNTRNEYIDINLLKNTFDIDLNISALGKKIEIKSIKKEIFASQYYKTKNRYSVKLIHPAPITQIAVALETGLRHQSIQWLSNDFDYKIKSKIDENSLYEIMVKVDKVKNNSWFPYVSGRVVNLLRNVRKFNENLNYDCIGKNVLYDGTENKWGSFVPLMQFNMTNGMPYGDKAYSNKFKYLLLGVDDLLEDLNIDYKIFKNDDDKVNLKCDVTPHSTRVMVVSELVNYLPPEYISRYITGHSVPTVSYYTKLNDDDLSKLKDVQSKEFTLISEGKKNNQIQSNINVSENSTLKNSFNEDPKKAIVDFGCINIIDGEDNWEKLIKTGESLNFSYESTHICPYSGICPKNIIENGLHHRCTLCPYAIRSIDHLPAICAARRNLVEKIEWCEKEIDISKSNTKKIKLQEKRKIYAEDLSAYSLIRSVLNEKLNEIKHQYDEKYFTFKPDAIKKDIELGYFADMKDNEAYILSRMIEIRDFPDLESQEIKSKISMLAAKILAATGNIRELIKGEIFTENSTAYSYSLIKTILKTNKISQNDLIKISNIETTEINNNFLLNEIKG